jgi:histidinol-phosphate aminotransferase
MRAALLAAGYEIPPSEGNFLWFPLGERTTAWAEQCERAGVIVRPFAGSGARVTVSSAADNDRFLAAALALSPK